MIIDKNNSFIYFTCWEDVKESNILDIIDLLHIKNLIIDCATEWEPNFTMEHVEYQLGVQLDFINELKIRKVETQVILGGYSFEDYAENFQHLISQMLNNGLMVSYFPSYWLNETYRQSPKLNFQWTKKTFNTPSENLGYIFVNKPHNHRCIFIDEMYGMGLDKYINFTWNLLTENDIGYPYQFKNWKEKIVIDEDDTYGKTDHKTNWDLPSDKYFSSVFEIVLETHIDSVFISEKTWKPIIYGKPFVVFGRQYFHKRLQELGFRLYTNFIDYTFDEEPDPNLRARMLLEQLNRWKDHDYERLTRTMRPVAEHNMRTAKSLIKESKKQYGSLSNFGKMNTNAFGNIELYLDSII